MNNWRVNQRGNRWIVERNMPCINGLSAWVEVVDCGEDDPSDEMFGGFNRRQHALLCLSALAGCDVSHAQDAFEAGLSIGGSIAGCYEIPDDASASQAEPFAYATHHDEPMLFPTREEALSYCDDDEEPIELFDHRPATQARPASGEAWIHAGWKIEADESSAKLVSPINGPGVCHVSKDDGPHANRMLHALAIALLAAPSATQETNHD